MELRFFRILTVSALGLTTLFVLFCYVVDPFGVFLKWRIPGFNQAKIIRPDYTRFAVPYQTFVHRPDGVLLGNSRMERSMDPGRPAFKEYAERTANLATAAATGMETYRVLQHAHLLKPLSLAVVGLDESLFKPSLRIRDKNFPQRLLQPQTNRMGYFFSRLVRDSLFSLTAFRVSLETILSQKKWPPYSYAFEGPGWTLAIKRRKLEIGTHALFQMVEKKFLKFPAARRDRLSREDIFQGKIERWTHFRKLIRLCRENNVHLVFLIHPSHARMQEVVRVSGDWEKWERLKRDLVKIIAEEENRTPGGSIPLWDFSGYNSITTEPVPPLGDKEAEMNYFFETSHNTIQASNLVIERIFGYEDPSGSVPEDFGFLLTPETIESHLKSIREKQREYHASHPEDVREVEEAWRRIKNLE